MDTLVSSQATLQQSTEWTVIQWIPSHYNIPRNERADIMAKDGGKLPQDVHEITFTDAKAIEKERQRRWWLEQHPFNNRQDVHYLFPIEDKWSLWDWGQVTTDSDITCSPNSMLVHGHFAECPCSTPPMTVQHLVQNCLTHPNLWAETWPADTPVRVKLYGPFLDLLHTAAFVWATGVVVWANDEEEVCYL